MCILMGVAPGIFLRPMEPAVQKVVQLIQGVGSSTGLGAGR
jgi:hypothetical protein